MTPITPASLLSDPAWTYDGDGEWMRQVGGHEIAVWRADVRSHKPGGWVVMVDGVVRAATIRTREELEAITDALHRATGVRV